MKTFCPLSYSVCEHTHSMTNLAMLLSVEMSGFFCFIVLSRQSISVSNSSGLAAHFSNNSAAESNRYNSSSGTIVINGATISATVTPSAAICGSNISNAGTAAVIADDGTNSGASAFSLLFTTVG